MGAYLNTTHTPRRTQCKHAHKIRILYLIYGIGRCVKYIDIQTNDAHIALNWNCYERMCTSSIVIYGEWLWWILRSLFAVHTQQSRMRCTIRNCANTHKRGERAKFFSRSVRFVILINLIGRLRCGKCDVVNVAHPNWYECKCRLMVVCVCYDDCWRMNSDLLFGINTFRSWGNNMQINHSACAELFGISHFVRRW